MVLIEVFAEGKCGVNNLRDAWEILGDFCFINC